MRQIKAKFHRLPLYCGVLQAMGCPGEQINPHSEPFDSLTLNEYCNFCASRTYAVRGTVCHHKIIVSVRLEARNKETERESQL